MDGGLVEGVSMIRMRCCALSTAAMRDFTLLLWTDQRLFIWKETQLEADFRRRGRGIFSYSFSNFRLRTKERLALRRGDEEDSDC